MCNRRWPHYKRRLAAQGFDRMWRLRQEWLSPCYTTRWGDLMVTR
ncbi:DUF4113 domain-containing protein [Nibrella saemangeumensis]